RQQFRVGAYFSANYSLIRGSVPVPAKVTLAAADRSLNPGLRLIGLIYLGIGLYVLLRRWTAPKSTHFYIFCLVSFVFYSFKYTVKLNEVDWVILGGNILAGLFQPALFLHFVLTFPERKQLVRKHPWVVAASYVPAFLLIGLLGLSFRLMIASERLRWNLDR